MTLLIWKCIGAADGIRLSITHIWDAGRAKYFEEGYPADEHRWGLPYYQLPDDNHVLDVCRDTNDNIIGVQSLPVIMHLNAANVILKKKEKQKRREKN